MQSFWASLGIIFLAEMGDKTQIVAMAYGMRYGIRDAVLGILWAIAFIHLISVSAGKLIGVWIPSVYLQIVSALCFFGFAVWTLISNENEEEAHASSRHPIILIGTAFIVAEMGDKTMLATATLATTRAWLPVWAGSTIGMFLADGLGIAFGRWFGKHIPQTFFKWASALVFFVFALWTGLQAYRILRP